MSIEKALEVLKYDVRLIEYHINNGSLAPADLEKHMKDLPDCSHQILVGPIVETDLDEDTDDLDDQDSEEAVDDAQEEQDQDILDVNKAH